MPSLKTSLFVLFSLLLLPMRAAGQEIRYTATIHPLAAILEEVAGGRAEVKQLLPPGSSPHTFEPKPSDAVMLARSLALFYAGPNLDQEWTRELPTPRKIEMLELVPKDLRLPLAPHRHGEGEGEHEHRQAGTGTIDPHFWTDPITVKAMLPALIEQLSALDPAGRATYERNGKAFGARLGQLNAQVAAILAPAHDKPILLFHPSIQYLMKRYHLDLAGLIEPFPGREPSPKALQVLITEVRRLHVRALFTEPQLPERPARILAEAAGLQLYVLDPLGGTRNRQSYEEIILSIAQTLHDALK